MFILKLNIILSKESQNLITNYVLTFNFDIRSIHSTIKTNKAKLAILNANCNIIIYL